MKLRIRGNSIRLRLSQVEVASLEADGRVSDQINFGGGKKLAYALSVDNAIETPRAVFDAAAITVLLPATTVKTWLDPSEVSIQGSQRLAGDAELKILVEKDFACLQPREGEEQENLFPNPGSQPC